MRQFCGEPPGEGIIEAILSGLCLIELATPRPPQRTDAVHVASIRLADDGRLFPHGSALLDGDALGEVAGLVDVEAEGEGELAGEDLQRHRGDER